MACVNKICMGYVIVTNGIITDDTNVIFGVNPNAWKELPLEGVALIKFRQDIPDDGKKLPVVFAVPTKSTVSTVDNNCCKTVANSPVINALNVPVVGADVEFQPERLAYFNKLKGYIRLLDCCSPGRCGGNNGGGNGNSRKSN